MLHPERDRVRDKEPQPGTWRSFLSGPVQSQAGLRTAARIDVESRGDPTWKQDLCLRIFFQSPISQSIMLSDSPGICNSTFMLPVE